MWMDIVSSSAGQILVLAFRNQPVKADLLSLLLCLKTRTRVQLSQILPLTGASLPSCPQCSRRSSTSSTRSSWPSCRNSSWSRANSSNKPTTRQQLPTHRSVRACMLKQSRRLWDEEKGQSQICVHFTYVCWTHGVVFFFLLSESQIEANEPEFSQYGNHFTVEGQFTHPQEMKDILIPTSSINATGSVPVCQEKRWAQQLEYIVTERSSLWLWPTWFSPSLSLSPRFPNRRSCPRRWIRPAPSLLPRPSSPRTSCWPSSPKRSWWAESTGSWQVQVSLTCLIELFCSIKPLLDTFAS